MGNTPYLKPLGDGVLGTTLTALLTVAPRSRVRIKSITVANRDSSVHSFNLYLNTSGTPRLISSHNQKVNGGYLCEFDREYSLESGDMIQAQSDVANALEYTISGEEER